jgi:hypothetical protein
MDAGLHGRTPSRAGSALVVLAAGLLLLRAFPLARAYAAKLSARVEPGALAAIACGALVLLALAALAIRQRPRVAAAALGTLALTMVALSGNLPAALSELAIFAATGLAGDTVFRALAGEEAGSGDLHAVLACGLAAVGTAVLVLGEAGGLSRIALGALAAVLLVLRRRRLRALGALARHAVRAPRGDAPPALESVWLALSALLLLAVWAGVQTPDLSWDALAYHLPEARDIAVSGHVRALADLHPQTLLWRGHDAYLAVGFLFGNERVVQFLQCATGLLVFGAALALARRIGAAGSSALVVLALAAFPTAMLQLRAAYVDWPAALLVTAAAAQIAARPGSTGRLRVAGFLFGGAVAAKVFAVFAAPALLLIFWSTRPAGSRRGLAGSAACALLPLAPWLVWSHLHAGSVFAPYAASPGELFERVSRGHYFTRSPASGEARPAPKASSLLRLPYDLVYHSSRFEANGDGYNGLLVLLLLVGLAGWDARRVALFAAAALPFLVPWSLLYLPSIRFLFPVYPLYAVFTAEGLSRLTARFAGKPGLAAGAAVLATAAAFPAQIGSSGLEWKIAFGRVSREEALAARLPSLDLFERLGPDDRVVFVGENDRFHCPAGAVYRAEFLPVASWGADPEAWRRGLGELGITAVVWRSDRASPESAGDGVGILERLGDILEPVARSGPATLLRVKCRLPC